MKRTLLSIGFLAGVSVAAQGQLAIYTELPKGATKQGPVPLSAEVVVTSQTTTAAGSYDKRIAGRYYRDSKGRVRQDTGFSSVIITPGSDTVIQLNHEKRIAVILRAAPPPKAAEPSDETKKKALEQFRPEMDLGTKKIDGHTVYGKASSGNTREPLHGTMVATSREVWMSTDLQLPLYTKHSAPWGETTQEYLNIKQGDPDPSLFEIPEGYTRQETTDPRSIAASAPAP
jgi:hypothetical protein